MKERDFSSTSGSFADHCVYPEEQKTEVQGKIFLTFSLKSATGGRSSNLYQGNTYPRTHYSIILIFHLAQKPLSAYFDQRVTKVLPEKLSNLVDFGSEIG